MQDFRKLSVWRKSHLLTLDTYKFTQNFPKNEMYGLTSQIRRASASIPANIAEGCCRGTDPEFKHFLLIALGSASELEYHFLLAKDLGYLTQEDHTKLDGEVNEAKRMLITLIGKIKQ
jgi:four helix bundle protein